MLPRISEQTLPALQSEPFAVDSHASSSGITVGEIFHILRRHTSIIILCTLAFAALTATLVLLVRPLYTATSTVLIDPHRSDVINLNPATATVRNVATDEAAIESQVLLIESVEVLRNVVKSLNLTADPDFMPEPSILDPIKKLFAPAPANHGLSREQIAILESVVVLQHRLRVTRQQNSYLVDVSVSSHEPRKAAAVAKGIVDAYFTQLVRGKSDSAKAAASWMDQQLAELKARLLASDKAVADYRAAHQLVMTQGVTVNDQQIADLNTQLIQARAEAAQARAKYEQVARIAKNGVDPGSVTEALSSETIARLRGQYADLAKNEADLASRYGAHHPLLVAAKAQLRDTQRLINEEVHRILQSRRQSYEVAAAREASLEKSLKALQDVSTESGHAQVRLQQLQREADANRTLYDSFLSNYKEATARESLKLPEARIVSEPDIPIKPSFPRPFLFLAVATALGLSFGCILAIAVDHFDWRVKTLNQLAVITGLPALASVPAIGARELSSIAKRGRDALANYSPNLISLLPIPLQPPLMHYIAEEPNSIFAESIRAIRLAVQRAGRMRPMKLVMVTSAIDGEGKTTLAANLALAHAMLGVRTLLVEGDLRNPEMSRSLCPRARFGLLDVALGRVSLPQAILPDSRIPLSVLPSPPSEDTRIANELVFSNAMGIILGELKRHYDIIVVDAPPLMPLVDSCALGEHADGIILTVAWNHTPKDLVVRALDQLSSSHDRILGTVLTRVDLKRVRQYDYYYSSAYSQPYDYGLAAKQTAL